MIHPHMRRAVHGLLAVIAFLLLCGAAAAQTITGVVADSSGAIVPGVTVEAQNSANQQVRSATTDAAGRYRIVNLQPGTYAVTFTLEGFSPAVRPNITLTSDFTATVDIQLTVGARTDTITVTADAPLVDVQSSAAPQTMDRETMDTLPTGSRSAEAIGVLIPGVTLRAAGNGSFSRDVGGSTMMNQSPLSFRGTSDTVQVIQGMRRVYLRPGPEFIGVYINEGAVQEMTFGQGAEAMDMGQSGMRINIVPKSGGNVFHGTLFGNYTSDALQSKMNIDDRLRQLGFTTPTGVVKLWDFNPSVNGPIKRDRLWLSLAYRNWGVTNTAPITFNEATDRQSYLPGDKAVEDAGDIWDVTGRVTWQASTADNIAVLLQAQTRVRQRFTLSTTTSPEAAGINTFPGQTYQGRWTRVHSANLLFDAAFQRYNMENRVQHIDAAMREAWCYDSIMTPRTELAPYYTLLEQTTNVRYNLTANCRNDETTNNHLLSSVTYIRGAHEVKAGLWYFNAKSYNPQIVAGFASFTYRNGVPFQATLSLPRAQTDLLKADVGLWVQDRWRLDRLTVNYGLRLDMIRTGWPEQVLPPNPYTGNVRFEARETFVNWKDLSPRVGAAYDVFGTGRTAVKGSLARYVDAQTIGLNSTGNPMSALAGTVNRTWNDLNGDRTIFNADYTLQESELGPSTNQNFGRSVPDTTVDPALLDGWGLRPSTYEADLGVQHQLGSRTSVTAMAYHRWRTNQIATINTAVSRGDFSNPFCVTAPSDARLPGGGGYPICGLYDISSTALGRVANFVTSADAVGSGIKLSNSGVTMSANVRLANATLQGGFDVRNDRQNTCGLYDGGNPVGFGIGAGTTLDNATFEDGSRFCNTVTGYRPDVKFSGSYQLPWGIMTAATFQNAAGPSITGTWPATNAAIAPGLGRPLSAGANATKTVNLIQPQTVFGDRMNQIDLRVSKRIPLPSGMRVAINADFYNLTNNNWIIGYGTAFGPNFLRPSQVLSPRMFKIGGQFDF